MKERTGKLLDKALDAIEVAEGILDMGKPEMAAGRAYYAMSTSPRHYCMKGNWNFTHTDRSLAHMEGNLPRQKNSTPNITKV